MAFLTLKNVELYSVVLIVTVIFLSSVWSVPSDIGHQ